MWVLSSSVFKMVCLNWLKEGAEFEIKREQRLNRLEVFVIFFKHFIFLRKYGLCSLGKTPHPFPPLCIYLSYLQLVVVNTSSFCVNLFVNTFDIIKSICNEIHSTSIYIDESIIEILWGVNNTVLKTWLVILDLS